MIRAMPADERLDDLGPDDDVELEIDDSIEFAPDCEIVFVVKLRGDRLNAVEQFADDQGISFDEAVDRLVDEALAAHPQPRR
jgi:hypothetical protein